MNSSLTVANRLRPFFYYSTQLFILTFFCTLITAGCSKPTTLPPQSSQEVVEEQQLNQNNLATSTLTIVDAQGTPVSGAMVMIGMRESSPFAGNILVTDTAGIVQIPNAWTDTQPITIEADGYIRTTYLQRLPESSTLVIQRGGGPQRFELRGRNSGFGPLPKDGYLDVGVVFSAIPRSQAGTLQLSKLISPETDKIEVIGQTVEIPSNITIPRQKESYVFPVTLDKPEYRIYLPEIGIHKVIAAHARFPFKEVVDELRAGRSFFELINYFDFRQAGVHEVTIGGPKTSQDLAVNQFQLSPVLSLVAPKFDARYSMIGLSLAEHDGLYFVTDAKRLNANEKRTLLGVNQGKKPGLLISVLRRADNNGTDGAATEELSAVSLPANQSASFTFLPLIKSPRVQGRIISAEPPQSLPAVRPVGIYATLSKVEVIPSGTMKLEKKTTQWEVYGNEWTTSIELPELPAGTRQIEGSSQYMRWSVTYGGQLNGSDPLDVGPNTLEKVSHVTRSAIDL